VTHSYSLHTPGIRVSFSCVTACLPYVKITKHEKDCLTDDMKIPSSGSFAIDYKIGDEKEQLNN
jgi:hypothetical protein